MKVNGSIDSVPTPVLAALVSNPPLNMHEDHILGRWTYRRSLLLVDSLRYAIHREGISCSWHVCSADFADIQKELLRRQLLEEQCPM